MTKILSICYDMRLEKWVNGGKALFYNQVRFDFGFKVSKDIKNRFLTID